MDSNGLECASSGSARLTPTVGRSCESTGPACLATRTSKTSESPLLGLISSAGGSPARTSVLPESAQGLRETGQDSGLRCSESFGSSVPDGCSSKTFQGFSPPMPAETFEPLSMASKKSGTAWAGEFSTRRDSEFPNGDDGCSLSDILEPLYPYECYTEMPQWLKGEFERRKMGHHLSAHFLSGQRASSTEIFQFWSDHAPIHIRVLTVRECERLMGFPDDWTLLDTEPSETL